MEGPTAATFDFFFFFHWFGLQFVFLFLFYFLASVSLGTEKKKKNLYWLTGMGPQIVWKILSDINWVMMPNGCEKLSDEWWVMKIEWWKLSDEKTLAKQPLIIPLFYNLKQMDKLQNPWPYIFKFKTNW